MGEKTATKWIQDFGSLQELVNRVDEVKGKAGDDAARAPGQRAAQPPADHAGQPTCPPRSSAPTPADLAPVPWDRNTIHQLFDTLQFTVLRDRLYETFPDGLVPASPATPGGGADLPGFEVDISVLGPEEVAGMAFRACLRRTGRGCL